MRERIATAENDVPQSYLRSIVEADDNAVRRSQFYTQMALPRGLEPLFSP